MMNLMKKAVIKALLPAAGRGTRLIHVSGGVHKELLRIGPLSMIEHCLKMVLESGVTEVAVVIRAGKEDVAQAAEEYWDRTGPDFGGLTFIRQDRPRGVADAMHKAAGWAAGSPLAVVMPDNLVLSKRPALARMIEVFRQVQSDTIGAIPLSARKAALFGNVGLMTLEQPRVGGAPLVASYTRKKPGTIERPETGLYYKGMTGVIFLPDWVDKVDKLEPNSEGEFDDADLVYALAEEKRLYACILEGEGYDLGQPRGLAAARRAYFGK
jgi:UTP--glucose-1-phosphate uridylyltransferase